MTRARDVADTQDNVGGAVAPYVGGKNVVINGGMDIWARGTSISPAADVFTYLADRWMTYRGVTNYTVSRQVTGDTTNLPNIQYAARIQRTAGTTNTNEIYFSQSLETVNSIPFAAKTVTLSFYARKGADYSQASSAVVAQVVSGTGTDQNIVGGFTSGNAFISQAAVLTTTWQRFSYTGTTTSNITQLGIQFRFSAVGTAGANDYFEVTGVQLELGNQMTPFARAGGSIGGELALCQRYYWQLPGATTGVDILMRVINISASTSALTVAIPYPVTMRIKPTLVAWGDISDGTSKAFDTVVSQQFNGGWAVMNSIPAFGHVDLNFVTASSEL